MSQSPEYQKNWKNVDDKTFTTKLLYNNLLRRRPDTDGLNYWVDTVTSDKSQIVLYWVQTPELVKKHPVKQPEYCGIQPTTTQKPATTTSPKDPSTTQKPTSTQQSTTTKKSTTTQQATTTQGPTTTQQATTIQEPTTTQQATTTQGPTTTQQATTTQSTVGAPVGTRGPTGQWPSNTPDYDTPATYFASNWSQVQGYLNQASSGQVIEIAAGSNLSSNLTLTGGNTGWNKNVLVRPPLGKRSEVTTSAQLYLNAHHVTIAGIKANSSNLRALNTKRSNYAWIELGPQGRLFIVSTTDFGLYELVKPQIGVGADTMQIKAQGSIDSRGTKLVGSWLAGMTCDICSGSNRDHNDTVQYFAVNGTKVYDAEIRDTVLMSAGDKSIQSERLYGFVLRNSYISEPSIAADYYGKSFSAGGATPFYGYHAINGWVIDGEFYDNDFAGSVAIDSKLNPKVPYKVMQNNRANNKPSPGPVTDINNTWDSSYKGGPPPIPNLDNVWHN